jgi:hypothetical protein
MENGYQTWFIECRSLYRSGSLTTVARELARYQLNFTGEQNLRQDKRGTVRAGDYIFFYRKGNKNYQFRKGILHTTKENQQLREERVLVIKRHTWLL